MSGLLFEWVAGDLVEDGATIRGRKDTVAVKRFAAPLQAVGVVDLLPGKVGVVAHAAGGDSLPFFVGVVRGLPVGVEFLAHAQLFCKGDEDVEVGTRFAGRWDGGVCLGDAALGVCVGAFFFSPDGSRQDEVSELASGSWVEAVLNDEELDGA